MSKNIFDNTKDAYILKSNWNLHTAKILFIVITKRTVVSVLTNLLLFFLKFNLPINWLVKETIYKHFCGGINFNECSDTISKMKKFGVNSILDYSIEALNSEKDFNSALKKKIEIINLSKNDNSIPFAVFKPTSIGRYQIFKKVSENRILEDDELIEWKKIKERFKKICSYAKKSNVKILIDAEEFEVQTAIDDLALNMMKFYNNSNNVFIYNTIQLYRWDRISYIKSLFSKYRDVKFGFKLVRGAYMEKERSQAAFNRLKSPICNTKEETDKNFNSCIELMFDNLSRVDFFIASHNEKSNLLVIEKMKSNALKNNDQKVWFGQLYGMGDNISYNLAKKGYNVAKILPFGPIKNLIPYLIRRAEENSSFEGQTNRELNLINRELFRRRKV